MCTVQFSSTLIACNNKVLTGFITTEFPNFHAYLRFSSCFFQVCLNHTCVLKGELNPKIDLEQLYEVFLSC